MISHRVQCWAFDGRYAAMLIDEGYGVGSGTRNWLDPLR